MAIRPYCRPERAERGRPRQPREIFNSVSRVRQILFGQSRRSGVQFSFDPRRRRAAAGISCNSCHVNGASNRNSMSRVFQRGTAISIPQARCSIQGRRWRAQSVPDAKSARRESPRPYGMRTDRFLREFVRHVIVDEFAGPEHRQPSSTRSLSISTTLVFCQPSLGPGGRLVAARSSDAERRGEALFAKPFPHNPELSCSGCHTPSAAFVDHRQHDVGSGGLFKTQHY